MNGKIKRFHACDLILPEDDGEYVLYKDHVAKTRSMQDFHDSYACHAERIIEEQEGHIRRLYEEKGENTLDYLRFEELLKWEKEIKSQGYEDFVNEEFPEIEHKDA